MTKGTLSLTIDESTSEEILKTLMVDIKNAAENELSKILTAKVMGSPAIRIKQGMATLLIKKHAHREDAYGINGTIWVGDILLYIERPHGTLFTLPEFDHDFQEWEKEALENERQKEEKNYLNLERKKTKAV